MSNRLITPPVEEPITLAEAKAACRVDHADEDDFIEMLISAAREQCEHILQRAIMPQVREETLDTFPADIELRFPNIISVNSVSYVDATTEEATTIDSSNYVVDKAREHEAWLLPADGYDWPATADVANAVTVRYTCGYENAAAVPRGIKLWIGIAVSTLHKNRESLVTGTIVSKLPDQFWHGLIDRYQVWSI